MSNPLLSAFNTPFETYPFEEIKLEHFKPAFEEGIAEGKKEIEALTSNTETPTFKNTIEALERTGSILDRVSTAFFNLNSAETSDEMQQLAQELSPVLTAYSNEIMMDEKLFARVKEVFDSRENFEYTPEQSTLLENTYLGFANNGADLPEDQKEELKKVNTELAQLGLKFGENVLKDTNSFEMHITDETDLAGLPEGIKEAAAMTAKSKGKESGWVFTLDYPSYIPFMQYAENRALREKLYMAFGSKGSRDNENNNEEIVRSIAELRLKRAQILGFESHAAKTLERRMAQEPAKVYSLLDELYTHAKPVAEKDIQEVLDYAKSIGGPEDLKRWDFSFYSEKLKKEKFSIDDEILKPYFKLENVIDGAFNCATQLWGITFHQRTDIQKYHEDVMTYEVLDENGDHLAVFYADFFPRAGKRGGAWMTSYRGQNKFDGKNQRPHVSIVCNFTKPTASKPSLLTFNETTTLFHEFGHALHGLLANGYHESLSGTSVFWDFVELPSQLMENWCYEKECLDTFARHYETNEPIPIDLVQKIKDSANFLSGYATVRQVSLGTLDMSWHDLKSMHDKSVKEFEKEVMKDFDLFEPLDGVNTSCAFSHIFQGGYSAGYYSYKWAEVLEADAFELFKEKGIFDKETAQSFREHVLSKGGSEHPMELYKRFRGAEPSTRALLKKSGLIEN